MGFRALLGVFGLGFRLLRGFKTWSLLGSPQRNTSILSIGLFCCDLIGDVNHPILFVGAGCYSSRHTAEGLALSYFPMI